MFIFSMSAQKQEEATVQKFNQLVSQKKYLSAFEVLEDFDPKNSNSKIVLLKQDLVLRYFVTSLSHKMFSLKDIKPDEDIMDYRGKEGDSNMVLFDIEENLEQLIKKEPSNYKLRKALADYYYDVLIKYGGNSEKSYEDLKKLISDNYQIAIENATGDYMSYYSLGYLAILDKNYPQAINYFQKSVELNNSYPTSNYNLAVAYLYNNDDDNALKYALKSYELYTEPSYKSDAARIVSQLYFDKNDFERAIKYINFSNELVPNDYDNLKLLLKIYAKNDHKDLIKNAGVFLMLDPSNPQIYNDLEDIFYTYKKENELVDFLISKKDSSEFDNKALGTIYFYLAKYFSLRKDKIKTEEYCNKAKEYFSKVFDEKNEVFDFLKQLISNSEK